MEKFTSLLLIFKEGPVSVIDWIETHSDLVTAIATIAIAGFTLTLWWATRKLWKVSQQQSEDMKKSLATAKKAANAAKVSADNLPIVERAYVFAKIELKDRIPLTVGPKDIEISLYLQNYGRTPAIVKEIFCHVGIYPKDQVNGNDLTKSEMHYPIEAFIGSGEQPCENTKLFHITEAQFCDIIDQTFIIYCFGCVKYDIIWGQEHFHGFCWEYSAPDEKFALSPNEEFNYNT